nr:MAG TPA: hypothetical protein [Caudoviricetes sp.]
MIYPTYSIKKFVYGLYIAFYGYIFLYSFYT